MTLDIGTGNLEKRKIANSGIQETMTRQSKPLVSVIIPTYNRGWIVREAIDSVLSQDFHDFELIVVDDGSTDDTADILKDYRARITVLTQSNRGVSAARNQGVRSSSGQYIAFLDSDDRWLPQKLSRQIDFFDNHPDAQICQTEEIWIRNGRRVNPKTRHRKPSGMIFERSLELCLVSPSAVMMRRSLFGRVGLFDENFQACEDYDLWLRVSCRFPVYLIEDPLIVKQGGHADQLSRQPSLDKYRIQSIVGIIQNGELSKSQYAAALKVLREKCSVYASGCLKRGRKQEYEYYQALIHKMAAEKR
jgi:glycosyltransferase involved in cell wall biosynthesis